MYQKFVRTALFFFFIFASKTHLCETNKRKALRNNQRLILLQISSLRLKNFRSLKDSNADNNMFVMRKGVNFIVGENNVGKSSFLRGLAIFGWTDISKQPRLFQRQDG